MSQRARISVSIVSHGQAALIEDLLQDLRAHCTQPLEVILTLNTPEALPFDLSQFGCPVQLIRNKRAKGFAANHNAAFKLACGDYFCVLNPDIRLEQDPFPVLLAQLANPKIGVAAPLVLNPAGGVEDSFRRFPTPVSVVRKALFRHKTADYLIDQAVVFPDWVAGMFMTFRTDLYRMIGGFDEAYFLYYEDVDLCWRLRRRGYEIAMLPSVWAVHAARRASHRHLRYFQWHLSSMVRFFVKRIWGSVCGNQQ